MMALAGALRPAATWLRAGSRHDQEIIDHTDAFFASEVAAAAGRVDLRAVAARRC